MSGLSKEILTVPISSKRRPEMLMLSFGSSRQVRLRKQCTKADFFVGYWIQISGATVVAAAEIKAGRFGEASDKSYDDLRDEKEVGSLISANPARVVDNLASQEPTTVRTALVVGPLIYGEGSGPVNKRSIQAPEITRLTLQRKKGLRIGRGLNIWSNVHIHDLGNLLLALFEAAVSESSAVWNQNGVYFPENGKLSFGDLSKNIVPEARKQNLLETEEIEEITAEEANSLSAHAAATWGTNAILTSSRAQAQLHWSPSGVSLLEEIPEIVRSEAKAIVSRSTL
ncbi:uncharacterized protein Z518_05845 [Rhinocladiella mackenziei CBS 650.93]|uniref:NAD-dependent epimerase/dehydratase domain-containing protein n=1 Tax=Rhinocladiella mackenziei CBS 650.93 TaxID=1442369 RepID=A0A0D2H3J3_9EURO|nr:uncharacterized protein Z518_05845 [Rhinocladiella mackenziei CBS 650.93]KIX04973.1 hypothetical protein Z518_05845 [Rhinocladiella mackenziei CBS 650.93]